MQIPESLRSDFIHIASERSIHIVGIHSKKKSGPPRVLLVGGPTYKVQMGEVERHYVLKQDEFIKFVEASVDNDEKGWAAVQPELEHSEAVILMPDFTGRTHPHTYRELSRWRTKRAEPVLRYYPAGFVPDPEDIDYERLAFDTTRGIVDYSAEHLLTRAVNNGRYLERRIELRNIVIRTLLLIFLITSSYTILQWRRASAADDEALLFQRTLAMPPEIAEEFAGILREFRKTNLEISPTRQLQIKTLLTGWAKIEAGEITRISGNPYAKDIYLYGISKRDGRLAPMVEFGPREVSLDPISSIAGCSYSQRVVAAWEGAFHQTKAIQAWNLSGQLVDANCKFENTPMDNPVAQILCAPIGVDVSKVSPDVPGVICISTNAPAAFMTSEWLRWYIVREAFPLGVIDMSALDAP